MSNEPNVGFRAESRGLAQVMPSCLPDSSPPLLTVCTSVTLTWGEPHQDPAPETQVGVGGSERPVGALKCVVLAACSLPD